MLSKEKFFFILLMCVVSIISCILVLYPFEQVQAPTSENLDLHTSQTELLYDQNSRKNLISQNCNTFFDGCNSCFKIENGEAACTKRYCESYQKPYCTDLENPETAEVKNAEHVAVCDINDPLSQCEISQEL